MESEICIVVARARNGIIGGNNQLPWHLPADLKHFKAVTIGHPVIMGRKTYESIGKPLPGRRNIIVTTNQDYDAPGCDIVYSLEEAIELAKQTKPEKICILGGGIIFQQALPLTDVIYLTEVDAEPSGDIYFNFDPKDWRPESIEEHNADAKNPHPYTFITLRRSSVVSP